MSKGKYSPIPFRTSLNAIGEDAYFIRLSDNKGCFLCYDGESKDKTMDKYILRQGHIGACIFVKENGLKFIMQSGAANLELVKVTEIVGNDSSKN